MKKLLIMTAAAAMFAPAFAAETVVAEWDFTKEQLVSGKYTLYKRGDAAFVKDEKSGKLALQPCKVFPIFQRFLHHLIEFFVRYLRPIIRKTPNKLYRASRRMNKRPFFTWL